MEHKSEEIQTNWYTVKLLFESIHSGEPIVDKIDENYYDNDEKIFEESIILIKSKDIEEAHAVAEMRAKKSEHEYLNVYGQLVKWQFIKVIDVFELDDCEVRSGIEVYSRFIHTKKEDDIHDVISRYYPESKSN
ncbi:uncharacterized protein DUF4288 [Heliophilum fasciatum]|uniref:Uncharacterized protein DUF4288 n=2 Tax=Heliophilum fasciatum TaxID=35700 RepID=A0A4R2R906_9FIRM|nr:uncharacterized protein DUF4288 [Heliophilum fasciatum]